MSTEIAKIAADPAPKSELQPGSDKQNPAPSQPDSEHPTEDLEDSERPTHLNDESGLQSPKIRRSGRYSVFDEGAILLARYRIDEEIGRGAMGVVYQAWDLKLQRRVALKTLREESSEDPVRIERFRREIESLSGLRHPNIVSVHDIGEFQGRFWFVMDAIEGESLGARLRRGQLEPRLAFQLLLPICQAVSYAHKAGLVHRDIKPENILIDQQGCPYLSDFGLAYRLSQQTRLTATGQSVGTPAFMAPEQIVRGKLIDERTDIYALGATLFECLTASLPFADSQTYAELIFSIVNDDPVRPRAVRPEIARDAEAICLVCLEKDPSQRYQSVEDLIEDIERFLRGEAVSAQAPGWRRQAIRLFRRHWSLLIGLLIALSAVIGSGFMLLKQQSEYDRIMRITENLEKSRGNLLRMRQQSIEAERQRAQREAHMAKLAIGRGPAWDLQWLQRALSSDDQYWEGYFWRSQVILNQALSSRRGGQEAEARAQAGQLLVEIDGLKKRADRPEFEFFQADVLAGLLGDQRRACGLYAKVMRRDRGLLRQYACLRLIHDGGFWTQLEAFDSALMASLKDRGGDFPALHLLRAELYAWSGQAAKAQRAWSAFGDPGDDHQLRAQAADVARVRVCLLRAQGRVKEAWGQVQGWPEVAFESPFTKLLRLQLAVDLKDFKSARAGLSKLLEADPEWPFAWRLEERLSLELGDKARAAVCREKLKAFEREFEERLKAPILDSKGVGGDGDAESDSDSDADSDSESGSGGASKGAR